MKKRGCSCGSLILVMLFIIAGVLFWIAYPILFDTVPKPEDTPWPASLELVERSAWASEEIANPDSIDPMNGVSRITLHHDGMPPLPMKTESQIKSRIVSIRKSHSKKYADIGYHYIIDPLGRIWEGRPVEYQGAHVQGKNTNNIGILFLGNTYEDKPTDAALDGLYHFVRYLRKRYQVAEEDIKTHREMAQTGCPGKFLQEHIENARETGKFAIRESSGFNLDIDLEELLERSKEVYESISKTIDDLRAPK